MTAGRLPGKVAVVTGAARGIGRARALRFAQEGAAIIDIDLRGPVGTVVAPPSTPEFAIAVGSTSSAPARESPRYITAVTLPVDAGTPRQRT